MKGKIENLSIRIRSFKLKFEGFLARVRGWIERVRAIKKRLEFLSPLLKRENVALLILGVVIVYGIIAQVLGWV